MSVLQALRDAIGPALPAGVNIAVSGTELQVSAASVVVGLTANPFAVRLLATPGGLPGVGSARVEVVVDGSGLQVLDVTVGPAQLDIEGATLRPYARVSAGRAPAAGRRMEIGLGLTDDGARRFAVRWNLGGALDLVALDGTTVSTDPAAVAGAVVEAVVDLAGGIVVGLGPVQELLGRSCGASTIGAVLEGVLVHDDAGTFQLLPAVFDLTEVLARLQQLALNLCRVAKPKLDLAELSLALVESPPGTLGVELIPKARYALGGDDVTVALEFDSSWIGKDPVPDPGLLLRVLHVGAAAGDFSFTPGIEIDGIGIRVARASGPLLDLSALTIASVAVHAYGEVGVGTGTGGGIQLQLSDLAVGTAGATGGGNGVASGVMKDAGTGPDKLAPRFSPSVSVQKVPAGPGVLVGLRAGDPPGPWWLAIQKGFGPVYIEQVGFDVRVEQRQLQSISLLLDGRVSIFGLTAAVDDLSLTFVVASDRSFFDPSRWDVDLAGFAISSDLGGLTLVGGLRKFAEPGPPSQPATIQYIGMLLARFGTYGLSVFGGYGTGRASDGSEFASFFAFGAVNGPIGGPPAFFLTGIGGGLGINRDLVFPSDLSRFGSFPFIAALDPGYTPPSDPMAVLQQYKDTFPIKQGQFWFAAGISFNSFALVDGVAVVAISVGDGFELALLGLARMALPRPQFALVSIELGLVCRFSSKEGVLWIQAQLTDNSWLLFPEIRLTGGFAFVSWFSGPNRGQFVLTMGGYHPDFHRDGYPTVPRLGFAVDLGFISLKGENYFALTSEAVMAGGQLEGSADLGPAWAHVVFGADGIIFFDPFWLDVRVYCQISAGITVDLWFATVTISASLGAQIHLQGPEFHGEVEFDVGPVSLTLAFGDDGSEPHFLDFGDLRPQVPGGGRRGSGPGPVLDHRAGHAHAPARSGRPQGRQRAGRYQRPPVGCRERVPVLGHHHDPGRDHPRQRRPRRPQQPEPGARRRPDEPGRHGARPATAPDRRRRPRPPARPAQRARPAADRALPARHRHLPGRRVGPAAGQGREEGPTGRRHRRHRRARRRPARQDPAWAAAGRLPPGGDRWSAAAALRPATGAVRPHGGGRFPGRAGARRGSSRTRPARPAQGREQRHGHGRPEPGPGGAAPARQPD